MIEFGRDAIQLILKIKIAIEDDVTILFDSFTHIYLMFCPCFIYKMP
jgi:hypothetical protein